MPKSKKSKYIEDELIDYLAGYINTKWEEELSELASFTAGAEGDEQAARELIETFLEFCNDLKIVPVGGLDTTACLSAMKKMLGRVLTVDMNEPANRKGALPKAIGLASRRDAVARIQDRIIYYAYEHARYHMDIPDRTHQECADLVALAFQKTGKIDKEKKFLTPEKITKTYQRLLKETLGGS